MTHIEMQRQTFAINKLKVMKLLHWDELQYHNLQFEAAYQYLENGMGMDSYWINALTRLPLFWKFWTNQWNIRDAHCFIPNASLLICQNRDIEDIYKSIHHHKFIVGHPSRKMFDDAYAIMIGKSFIELKKLELCHK